MAKKKKVEKLTNYDPAGDLGSDEAIAIFMAEAFLTNDRGVHFARAGGGGAGQGDGADCEPDRAVAGATVSVV